MSIVRIIKNCLKKSSTILKIYESINVIKTNISIRMRIPILKAFGHPVLSALQVRKILNSKAKNDNKDKVFHVIGSGWSLNKSISMIKPNEFVFGFNFAALSGIKFDAYFVEHGGLKKVKEISDVQIKLIEEVVKKQTDLVFFKNIWDGKNEIGYMHKNWPLLAYFVRDIDFTDQEINIKNLNDLLKIILIGNNKNLMQYCSSAVVVIALAYQCGYKNIVLHGVDFGGEYFFDAEDFKGLKEYIPPRKTNYGIYSYQKMNTNDIHDTAKSKLGLKQVIPILKTLLEEKNVFIYSASAVSPLADMLPIYNTNNPY
jgi:hypothetical protein